MRAGEETGTNGERPTTADPAEPRGAGRVLPGTQEGRPGHHRQGRLPHVVAMNYFARDGAFYMTSYGKAQKVVNIRRNPKVAVMIEAGDEYAELRGVMIQGRCEILDDEASVRAAFEARAVAQASASPVQPGALASAPKRVVLKIVPEKG